MHAALSLAVLAVSMFVVGECVMNYPRNTWPNQMRIHRSGPPGQMMRYRSPVKRVYVPYKYMQQMQHFNQVPMNRNHRIHNGSKIRYGPPLQNKRSPAPPPGWKPKRMSPPVNYVRKNRTKLHKYQKPLKPKYENYKPSHVITDSYGAPKKQQFKITSTTYGIPHPTQGSPEPPKKDEVATSYVQVYQGDYQPDRELEAKTSYSFSNTHYTEKHKGKVYDDSNHRPVYNASAETPAKKGFQPPKQTFGFHPYEDAAAADYQKSGSEFFKTTTTTPKSQKSEEYLSPNYYDQQS